MADSNANPNSQIRVRKKNEFLVYIYFNLNGEHFSICLGDEAPVPEDGIKPTFTERPMIRQSDDGGKITFECRCVGDPKPMIAW